MGSRLSLQALSYQQERQRLSISFWKKAQRQYLGQYILRLLQEGDLFQGRSRSTLRQVQHSPLQRVLRLRTVFQFRDTYRRSDMDFYFYSPVAFEKWDFRNSIETGIGGSETSHVEMAWRLARRGHKAVTHPPIRH